MTDKEFLSAIGSYGALTQGMAKQEQSKAEMLEQNRKAKLERLAQTNAHTVGNNPDLVDYTSSEDLQYELGLLTSNPIQTRDDGSKFRYALNPDGTFAHDEQGNYIEEDYTATNKWGNLDTKNLYIGQTPEGMYKLGIAASDVKPGYTPYQARYMDKTEEFPYENYSSSRAYDGTPGPRGVDVDFGGLMDVELPSAEVDAFENKVHRNAGMLAERAIGQGPVTMEDQEAFGFGKTEYTTPDAPLWNIDYDVSKAELDPTTPIPKVEGGYGTAYKDLFEKSMFSGNDNPVVGTVKAFGSSLIKELGVDTVDWIGETTGFWDVGTDEQKTKMVNDWFSYNPSNIQEAQQKVAVLNNVIWDKNTTASQKIKAAAEAAWTAFLEPELLGQSFGVLAAWLMPGALFTKGSKIQRSFNMIDKMVDGGKLGKLEALEKKRKLFMSKEGIGYTIAKESGHLLSAAGNINDQYDEFVKNNNGVGLEGTEKYAWFAGSLAVQLFNQKVDQITDISILKSPSLFAAAKSTVKALGPKEFTNFAKEVGKKLVGLPANIAKEAGQEYAQRMMEIFNERYGAEKFSDTDSFIKFLTNVDFAKEASIDALMGAGGAGQFQAVAGGKKALGTVKDYLAGNVDIASNRGVSAILNDIKTTGDLEMLLAEMGSSIESNESFINQLNSTFDLVQNVNTIEDLQELLKNKDFATVLNSNEVLKASVDAVLNAENIDNESVDALKNMLSEYSLNAIETLQKKTDNFKSVEMEINRRKEEGELDLSETSKYTPVTEEDYTSADAEVDTKYDFTEEDEDNLTQATGFVNNKENKARFELLSKKDKLNEEELAFFTEYKNAVVQEKELKERKGTKSSIFTKKDQARLDGYYKALANNRDAYYMYKGKQENNEQLSDEELQAIKAYENIQSIVEKLKNKKKRGKASKRKALKPEAESTEEEQSEDSRIAPEKQIKKQLLNDINTMFKDTSSILGAVKDILSNLSSFNMPSDSDKALFVRTIKKALTEAAISKETKTEIAKIESIEELQDYVKDINLTKFKSFKETAEKDIDSATKRRKGKIKKLIDLATRLVPIPGFRAIKDVPTARKKLAERISRLSNKDFELLISDKAMSAAIQKAFEGLDGYVILNTRDIEKIIDKERSKREKSSTIRKKAGLTVSSDIPVGKTSDLLNVDIIDFVKNVVMPASIKTEEGLELKEPVTFRGKEYKTLEEVRTMLQATFTERLGKGSLVTLNTLLESDEKDKIRILSVLNAGEKLTDEDAAKQIEALDAAIENILTRRYKHGQKNLTSIKSRLLYNVNNVELKSYSQIGQLRSDLEMLLKEKAISQELYDRIKNKLDKAALVNKEAIEQERKQEEEALNVIKQHLKGNIKKNNTSNVDFDEMTDEEFLEYLKKSSFTKEAIVTLAKDFLASIGAEFDDDAGFEEFLKQLKNNISKIFKC